MHAAILRKTGDTDLDIVDDCELRAMGPGRRQGPHHPLGRLPFGPVGHERHDSPTAARGARSRRRGRRRRSRRRCHHRCRRRPRHHRVVTAVRQCKYCVDFKQPNLCLNMMFVMGGNPQFRHRGDTIGAMAGAGTFAEYTIVPQQASIKIDDDIPLEVAALIGCGVMTGAGAAINTAKVAPGHVGHRLRRRRRRHQRDPGCPHRGRRRDPRGRRQPVQARRGQGVRRDPRVHSRGRQRRQGADHGG